MGESHATSRSSRARAARCVRWSRPCSCSQAQSGRFGSKAPLWRLQPLVHSFSLTPVFSGLPWEKSRSTVSKDAISAILASHHSQLQGPARVRTGQARPPDDHFAPADVCGGRPAGDGGRHEVDIPREIGRVGGLVLLLPLVLSGNLPSRRLGFLKHPLEIAPRTPPPSSQNAVPGAQDRLPRPGSASPGRESSSLAVHCVRWCNACAPLPLPGRQRDMCCPVYRGSLPRPGALPCMRARRDGLTACVAVGVCETHISAPARTVSRHRASRHPATHPGTLCRHCRASTPPWPPL